MTVESLEIEVTHDECVDPVFAVVFSRSKGEVHASLRPIPGSTSSITTQQARDAFAVVMDIIDIRCLEETR